MANDYITKAYLDLRFDEFEDKIDSKLTQLKSE